MTSGRAPRRRGTRSRALAASVVELAHVLAKLTPFVLGLATIWFVISLALWGSAGRAGREALTVVVIGVLIGPLELMMHDGFSLKRIAVAIWWFILLLPGAVAVLEWGGI
jgi:hypothetical protein